jgi:hypothetical protein
MTIDEAIKHCEEVAEKNEKECKNWAYGASQINDDESRKKQYLKHAEMWKECAKEHRQLAEWLKELKAYRGILANADKIIESEYGCVIIEGYADVIDKMNEVFKEANADDTD